MVNLGSFKGAGGDLTLFSFLCRKGVAKAMLTKVMEEARKRDIHNIYTFIRVDNKVRREGGGKSN